MSNSKCAMKTLFLTLVLVIGMATLTSAANYYFLVDPACMDKLEYETTGSPGFSTELVYSYRVGDQKIILEVGQPNGQVVSQMDGVVINCTNQKLNASQISQLQSPGNRMFIASALATYNKGYSSTYQVFPVHSVGVLQSNASGIRFQHWKYAFNYPQNTPIGQPLPGSPTGSTIAFQGTEQSGCLSTYVFRQFFNFEQGAYIDLKVIPEIGITAEVSNTPGAAPRTLARVNDQPLALAINQRCGSTAAGLQSRGGSSFMAPPPSSSGTTTSLPSTLPNTATSVSTPPSSSEQYHTVQKGETLWSISQKYGLSVKDLQSMNTLSGNRISVKQRLMVAKGAPQAAAVVPTTRGGGQSLSLTPPAGATPAASYSPSWNQPPPVPQNIAQASNRAWRTTNGSHQVAPGETVASIAMQYGYTEERFRDMNNLGPYDIVQVNQQVRTMDNSPSTTNSFAGTSTLPAPYGTNPTSSGLGQLDNTTYGTSTPARSGPGFSNPYDSYYAQGSSGNVPFEPYGGSGPSFDNVSPPTTSIPSSYNNPPSGFNPTTSYPPSTGSQGMAQPYPNNGLPTYPTNTQPSIPSTTTPPPATSTPAPSGSNPYTLPTISSPSSGTTRGGGTPFPYNPSQGSSQLPTSTSPSNPTPSTSYGTGGVTNYGTSQPVNVAPSARGVSNQAVPGTHVVQPGESLASVAQRYGLSVNKLRQMNNLKNGDIIVPFQRLYVQ